MPSGSFANSSERLALNSATDISGTDWHRLVWGSKLAQFAATLTKGAHIEVEGQLRHRTYQKQIQAGKKTVAVDVTVAEIHAIAIRKLDRNRSAANSSDENVSEGAPE
jgi:single-strand DNA-binding protein